MQPGAGAITAHPTGVAANWAATVTPCTLPLSARATSPNPCEPSLYKGKHWGYSCNVSVMCEGRLLKKMARGAGLFSVNRC